LGVNLRDLFPQHPVPEGWYLGKRIAVDGPNVAFRYLTSFRGRDGDVLRNRDGRVVAHLIGYLNLVRHLRERGAEPIVVWDGKVHPRKLATVEERIARRVEAALNAEEALAAGDQEAHQKFLRATTTLDGKMVEDCSRLLEALGVAVVRAEHDAERHATALCHAGFAQAVATEDFDALVAGAPTVLRKAGSPEPFLHHLSDLRHHGLTVEQLRAVAILCGTDWNPGVRGFGAKTAVKMLRDQPDLRVVLREAEEGLATTRYHRMIKEAGFTQATFGELDRFIAELPQPQAPPRAPKPDPGMAAAVAEEMGLEASRVLACFC
jgi:flap endonuclease-1